MNMAVGRPRRLLYPVVIFLSAVFGAAFMPNVVSAEADPGPTITSISPNTGSTAGGDTVTITGENLIRNAQQASVRFDGIIASVSNDTTTSLTVETPAHNAGTVDVTVTTGGGTATTQFTYVSTPPTVTSVSPSSGSIDGNETVTITGTNFLFKGLYPNVSFGDGTAFVNSATSTSLTVTTPAHSSGTVDVTVSNDYGTSAVSAADQYTYGGLPVVTSVSPTSGSTAGGNSVSIHFSNWEIGKGGNRVFFGDVAATSFSIDNPGVATATAPAHDAGTVDITIQGANGQSAPNANDKYTFAAPTPPTVTSVSPSSGSTAGGNTVTVHFTNWEIGKGGNRVFFGDVEAPGFSIDSEGVATVTAPAHGPGTVDVEVQGSNGRSSANANDKYTFVAPNVPPTVAIVPGQTCDASNNSGIFTVQVNDPDSTGTLTLSAKSSNTTLVPVSNVVFGGSGALRTVKITAASGKTGSSLVTVTVSDGLATANTTINVIVGTSNSDTLNGTSGTDLVFGGFGNDTINTGDGIDAICGGNDNDIINAGNNDDTVFGGFGTDRIDAGDGNDIVFGENDNDTIIGGNGDDELHGGYGADNITGDAGADSLFGEGDNDTLSGGADSDRLFGGAGNDQLSGGAGTDVIDGGSDTDTVVSPSGDSVSNCERTA